MQLSSLREGCTETRKRFEQEQRYMNNNSSKTVKRNEAKETTFF